MSDRLHALPPMNTYEQLTQFLRKELGYCGCAAPTAAIEVLRDILRCARAFQRALGLPDQEELCRKAYQELQSRLCFQQAPGTAIWLLYLLDAHDLIEHASNVTVCWISPRGDQLLDAIERCYPPPAEPSSAQ
jgi:hypothetical protein